MGFDTQVLDQARKSVTSDADALAMARRFLALYAPVQVSDKAAALVNELSGEWGWRQLPECTQAWCELSTHQPMP